MDSQAENKGLILLVEDEILVGMMLQKKIRSYGYEITDVITSGEEAVARARVENPDLLFMDVSLSGQIDGVEAARQIKEFLDVPVIFFTGNHMDKKLIERSKELSPVAILDKLGSFDTVVKAVERALLGEV